MGKAYHEISVVTTEISWYKIAKEKVVTAKGRGLRP
jgi:hypothetical protein